MIKPLFGKIAIVLSLLAFSTVSFAADAKEWTILVYLNGHNNLDSFGKMNIEGMSQVGSTDKVNVIVQWASERNGKTKRLYVKKGGYDVIEEMAPADMGDYRTLVEFARWAQAKYPAKKYFVDVWNHGNGWHLQNVKSDFQVNDISYDDISGNHITTEQLGQAMGEIAKLTGGKIELYGSDACLMAMAEVASEMTNSVKYFAGSQETEPGEGWPYQTFLARLVKNPAMNGGELASILSQEYKKAYTGGVYGSNREVTFTAWDLSKMDRFNAAVKTLANELRTLDSNSMKKAVAAMEDTQSFALSDYKDISHYVDLLQAANIRVGSHTLGEVTASLKDLVIAIDSTPRYAKARGVSVWLPSDYDFGSYSDRYMKMNFNKQTGWGEFLKAALK